MSFKGESEQNSSGAYYAHRIEQTADKLGILSILRSEPTVQEYLRAHVMFEDMQGKLASAAARLSVKEPEEDFSPPYHKPAPDGSPAFYVPRKKRNLSPGIEHTLQGNYHRTVLLLEVAEAMTEEGLNVRKLSPAFLKEKLNAALDIYGLVIANGASEELFRGQPVILPFGVSKEYVEYRRRHHRHQKDYEKINKAEQEQAEATDENLKYPLIARDPATKQYVPYGSWLYAPHIHDYAGLLNDMQHFGIEHAGEHSVIEQGAYTSEEKLHWERIRDITGIANEMLWEGINGKTAKPYALAIILNHILDSYHLHVEPKPLDERKEKAIAWQAVKNQQLEAKYGRSDEAWAEIARNFTLDNKANSFGIPERNWYHPTIRTFIGAVIDAEDLQGNLSAMQSKHSVLQQLHYEVFGPDEEGQVPPGLPGIPRASLSQRCDDAELLMRVVMGIIDEGFKGSVVHPDYIMGKTNVALDRFGLETTAIVPKQAKGAQPIRSEQQPQTLWHDATASQNQDPSRVYYQYIARYGRDTIDRWYYPKERFVSPARNIQVDALAQRLGVDEENVQHPTVREFLGYIYEAETLLQTFEQGEVLPAPGITPSVAQRFERCSLLLQAVVAILEEGFQGQQVYPHVLKEKISTALRPYGIEIRERPHTDKGFHN